MERFMYPLRTMLERVIGCVSQQFELTNATRMSTFSIIPDSITIAAYLSQLQNARHMS